MTFGIAHDTAEWSLLIRDQFGEVRSAVVDLHRYERGGAAQFIDEIRFRGDLYRIEQFGPGTNQKFQTLGMDAEIILVGGVSAQRPTIKTIGRQARPGTS